MNIRLLFIVLIFQISFSSIRAQQRIPTLQPLAQNGSLQRDVLTNSMAKAALTLPFFDDFSYESSRPSAALWLDRQVFINRTMSGDRTPSVGVATFDGLNERGAPYAPFSLPQTRGGLDTLTSQTIDLANATAADSIIFSFWAQPKGLTYAPFELDSFIVEFRNVLGNWEKLPSLSLGGLVNNTPTNSLDFLPDFQYKFYKVVDNRFLHPNFQFRFRTLGRRQGNYETWHLDYVHLNKNRTSVTTFSDLAFMAQPRFALKRYSQKPWRHVKAGNYADLRDTLKVSIRNFYDRSVNTNTSSIRIQETTTNTNVINTTSGFTGIIRANTGFLDTFSRTTSVLGFDTPIRNNYNTRDSLVLETTYNFVCSEAEPTNPNYAGVTNNNSVGRKTTMNNEFAYDDGTAEAVISGAPVEGYTMALKFTSNVADTIRGVRINFPNLKSNASLSSFQLLIWQDALADPDNLRDPKLIYASPDTLSPVLPNVFVDTLQGFSTYITIDSMKRPKGIALRPGNFYIGWKTVGTTIIPVGFDRNNSEIANNEVLYLDETRTWRTFPSFGAPLVRVVTGRYTPTPTSRLIASQQEIALNAQSFSIYPNPVHNWLNIELKNMDLVNEKFMVSVFDLSGGLKTRQILGGGISTEGFSAGMYILKIENVATHQSFFQKIVVAK
ncbi:MAG: hypothetical protein RL757_524 [Bacteroidota bacterium]